MGKNRPEDLHPEDVDNLNRLKAQLQALCLFEVDKGVSKTEQAARVGRNHWFQHVLWSERTWPGFWKFSTFHDLCLSVGMIPTVTHPFQIFGPLSVMADANPRYLGVACQEMLEAQRAFRGLPVSVVADSVQVAGSAVWRTENSADPRVSTLQRYARAYDGWFKFGVGEA